jgi:hypothetical protein
MVCTDYCLAATKNHIEFRKSDLAYFEYQPFDQGSGLTPKYFNRPNQSNTLAWIYTINPTLVNEARATVSLDDVYIPVNTSAPGFNAQTLGINFPYVFSGNETNSFEFRAEAYDFINHPNWATFGQSGGPNVTPTSSAFGEVTQKSGLARNLQLSLRYSFYYRSLSGQTVYLFRT